MGLYAGTPDWVNEVYQFEETDQLLGGPDGIDNLPLKHLANRTQWLKQQVGKLDRLTAVVDASADIVLNDTHSGAVVNAVITAPGKRIVELPLLSSMKTGALIFVCSSTVANSVVEVVCKSGNTLFLSASRSNLFMHNAERIGFIAGTDSWLCFAPFGNFIAAGEEVKSRKPLENTLPLVGQVLQRAAYPRLWEFVQTLTFGQEVVNEATWLSDAVMYRGCFTTGDGATTFRLPDERGMFERMADLGRGIDLGRAHNFPGGYESDQNKEHSHTYRDRYMYENNSVLGGVANKETAPLNYNNSRGNNDVDGDNNTFTFFDASTASSGGYEVTVKNIAKYNLIKF